MAGSTARLVAFGKGYVVDINGFDLEALKESMKDEAFRREISKLAVPWFVNHPAVKHKCRAKGIVFGAGLRDEASNILLKEFGAQLITFFPGRLYDRDQREEAS